MRFVLSYAAKFYSTCMSVRSMLYAKNIFFSYKSKLPVISIGNVSAGGTGKTPLCIFLAKALIEKKFSPVILSRGYRGSYSGIHVVKRGDDPSVCGDEPLLMANSVDCPVILSRDRINGAKFIEENNLGNLIILDDALQHIRLKRDVDIVMVNIGSQKDVDDFLGNRVIPLGHLREDRNSALGRADFVVLSSRMPQSKAKPPGRDFLKLIPPNKVIVSSYFEAKEVLGCANGEKLPGIKEVVAFCGIANPEGFFTTLESMGYKIADKIIRRDHYAFSGAELERLKNTYNGTPLVCTEKDAVRLPESSRSGLYKLTGALKVIPEDAFLVQIEKRLKSL